MEDERFFWSPNCVDYLNSGFENANNSLVVNKTEQNNEGDGHGPYESSFSPELDVTEELVEKKTNMYPQFIGVLRW